MDNPLDDIERRLQSLIESDLVKYLPQSVTDDHIAELLADAMKENLTTHGLTQPGNNLPTEFLLVVHPSKVDLWKQDTHLLVGLNRVVQQVVNELGLKYLDTPILTIASDASFEIDQLVIRINKPESVAETQNMLSSTGDTPARSAFLIVGGTNVFTLNQTVTNIGRRFDNQIILDDPRVSRYHAQIRLVRNHFLIFDLNSTGGTFVNGQQTTQSILYPGDVISLAGLPIIFGQDSQPPTQSKGDTAPLSPASSERATIFLQHPLSKNEKHL
ncbi:MAG: FHA domain-containing protein [Chloroflexota bacterium]